MKKFYQKLLTLIIFSVFFIMAITAGGNNFIRTSEEPVKSSGLEYVYSPKIYYSNSDYLLVPIKKEIKVKENNIYKAIFEEMKNSPENKEIFSLLGKKSELKSFELAGRTLILNISEDFLNLETTGRSLYNALIYSIVNTYSSFDTIDKVDIRVNDVDLSEYFTPIDYKSSGMVFNDHIVYKDNKTPSETVSRFFEFLLIKRYDLAYKLTVDSYKNEMNITSFEKKIKDFLNKTPNVTREIIKSKKTDDGYLVLVSLNYFDNDGMIYTDCQNEFWHVLLMKDGSFKLLLKTIE